MSDIEHGPEQVLSVAMTAGSFEWSSVKMGKAMAAQARNADAAESAGDIIPIPKDSAGDSIGRHSAQYVYVGRTPLTLLLRQFSTMLYNVLSDDWIEVVGLKRSKYVSLVVPTHCGRRIRAICVSCIDASSDRSVSQFWTLMSSQLVM